MEASLINALHRAGVNFGERLHYWHGNLLFLTDIGHHSIPGNWGIAKRRYLENALTCTMAWRFQVFIRTCPCRILSLPGTLCISPTERGDQHLDEFKSGILYHGIVFVARLRAVSSRPAPPRPCGRGPWRDAVVALTSLTRSVI